MVTGIEGLIPVQGQTTVAPTAPSDTLFNINELGREFEQTVFGDAPNPETDLASTPDQQAPSITETIGSQLVNTMEGLNNELESTMQEVMRLISSKPDPAELLQLQLKASQLFITHELSSKIVSKATSSIDQLVHSQ